MNFDFEISRVDCMRFTTKYFSPNTYVMTSHENCLTEGLAVTAHNIFSHMLKLKERYILGPKQSRKFFNKYMLGPFSNPFKTKKTLSVTYVNSADLYLMPLNATSDLGLQCCFQVFVSKIQ